MNNIINDVDDEYGEIKSSILEIEVIDTGIGISEER